MSRIAVIQCTLIVEVEIPDGMEHVDFVIEENGCPGTGIVGAEIDRVYEDGQDRGVCWACNLRGSNKILEVIEK